MVRGRLLKHWRAAIALAKSPVDAWASIVENSTSRSDWQKQRGLGGFVRSTWDEVNQMIAAANVYTIKKHGPDRIIGFSPIPAMSMISYAAGSRYLSLIGGVCMSFYDWYCDLPQQPANLGRANRRARSRPTGTTARTSLPGAPTCPRRARRRALLDRGALQGHQGRPSRPTIPKWPSWATCGCTQAGHRRGRGHGHGPCDPERFYFKDGGNQPTLTTTPAATPTCHCWWCSGKDAARRPQGHGA